MSTPVILDLAILAILALSLVLGWVKGMVRGLLTLAGTILAILVASQIGDVVSDLVVEQVLRPATHAALEQRILELDTAEFTLAPLEMIHEAINAIGNDFVREKAQELLASVNIPTAELTGAAQDAVLRVSRELADTVLRGPVRDVLAAVICLVCFLMISLALRPIIWMIEQAFKLPLLKQVNQIGGLLSGMIRGIVLVLIAVWVLRATGTLATDEVVAQSYLLRLSVLCLDTIL